MRFIVFFSAVISIIITAQSCVHTSEIATEENGIMKADVGEGKVIYMRDCTRCHEQKKVEDFSPAQWSNILPRMVIQAQLNDTESRQVKAYIEWKLEND